MKKILLVIPIIVLVAAGCSTNKSPSTATQPTPTPVSNSQSSDQATDWQIYSNATYGYEFSYPKDWVIETNQDITIAIPKQFQEKNRDLALTIAAVNVGRESVFDTGAKANCEMKEIVFAGRKAKECASTLNSVAARSVKILDLPANWKVGNEISYSLSSQYTYLVSDYEKVISSFKFTNTTSVNIKLQVCPQEWWEDDMPIVQGSPESRQYYILNGQRRELGEFDRDWVSQNCNLKLQKAV